MHADCLSDWKYDNDLLHAQAVMYAPDEAAVAALEALLHSGHLQAYYQPADSSSCRAGDSAQQAAPDPGSMTVCLSAAAFAEPVAADEAAQRPWNRQLAMLLPWLAPQHSAAAVMLPAGDAPLLPSRDGIKFVSGASSGAEPGSPPQSPLARRKVDSGLTAVPAFLLCRKHDSLLGQLHAELTVGCGCDAAGISTFMRTLSKL